MTKKDQAIAIANQYPEASRKELIVLFKQNIPDISPGAASTYASAVRKQFSTVVADASVAIQQESDEEIEARIAERFAVIDKLASASVKGKVRSLIVSGAPGTGKSHSITKALTEYDPNQEKTAFVSGYTRATGLYLLLHEYRHKGSVIVLDDIDSIFNDEVSLNILKAALDTTHKRIISWRSETKMIDADGEPVDRSFEFHGSVIFLTNINFDRTIDKGGKLAPHLSALQSRSMYIDSDINTQRDRIVRIKQVVRKGMLNHKNVSEADQGTIITFLENNADRFRELSLRAVLKLTDLYTIDPSQFEQLAKVSLFKH